MKKSILFCTTILLFVFIFSSCGESLSKKDEVNKQSQLEERAGISALNYVQVSESVVMVQHDKDQGSNMICVVLDDGLVFFDCSLFVEIGQEFRKTMEEKYQRKTLALVQSHAHSDHFFGMDAFKDVPYITTTNAKRMFEFQLSIDYQKYKEGYMQVFPRFDKALESAKFRMPSIWFDGELELGSGDSKLILRNAGGHTECSIYAYFEKEKVLLAGDDIQVDYHPYFGDQTGSLKDWVDVLKVWETMDIDHVCAGHGPLTDKTYITKARVFFEELEAKFRELKSRNASEEEVLKEINTIEKYWPTSLQKPGWYDASIIGIYRRM